VVEAIRDGISLVLGRAFPACGVHGDEGVRQGLSNPCFFVGLGEYRVSPLPCGLWEVRQAVDVVYFPEQDGAFGELWSVGPRVLSLLSTLLLPDSGMVRGTGLRCAVSDGLMHVHGTYRLRVRSVEWAEKMGELDHRRALG